MRRRTSFLFRKAHSLSSPRFFFFFAPPTGPRTEYLGWRSWGAPGALTLGLRPDPYCLRRGGGFPKDATYRERLLSAPPPPAANHGREDGTRVAIPPYTALPPPITIFALELPRFVNTRRNQRRGLRRSSSRFGGAELWSLATREAAQQGCW